MSRSTFVALAPRHSEPSAPSFRQEKLILALLMVMAIGLAVIPEVITHLNVKHSPDLPPLEDDSASSKFPLAHLFSLAGSAALLGFSTLIAIRRGRPNRNVIGVLILLLAVNLPYVTSPGLPAPTDIPKIVLANTLVLALWNTGASVAALKWLPITVSIIGAYSLIGGFVAPDYMMYNIVSEKAIIGGWELAGPFGHGNVLGMYCAVTFSLVPLVKGRRWQVLCAAILFTTSLASASRTAVIASVAVILWWGLCRFRSMLSIRLAGTVIVSVCASATLVFPFLSWNPHAFTDRAEVWAFSLAEWQQSPIVGLGVNWFMTDAKWSASIALWAYVGTGHNLVVDTLVKSGLLGLCVLAPILVSAILSARERIGDEQIAAFGYLIAFFVAATTEAVWALLPNIQLFPISGMIFAVLVLARHGGLVVERSSP